MKKIIKKCPQIIALENAQKDSYICEIKFKEYLGQTVTVYVNAGGSVGNGFTGVLIAQTGTYIKLLVRPSAAPVCSLGDRCNGKFENPFFCMSCPYVVNEGQSLGTMAEIPINAIVAFVHNIVSQHNC